MLTLNALNTALLVDGVEIVPHPDLLSLEERSESFSSILTDTGLVMIKAKLGLTNLTLYLEKNQLISGSLWVSQPEDKSASWDNATENEAKRHDLHKRLIDDLKNDHPLALGPYKIENSFDAKTYMSLITISKI
jgi:hypothetical protein